MEFHTSMVAHQVTSLPQKPSKASKRKNRRKILANNTLDFGVSGVILKHKNPESCVPDKTESLVTDPISTLTVENYFQTDYPIDLDFGVSEPLLKVRVQKANILLDKPVWEPKKFPNKVTKSKKEHRVIEEPQPIELLNEVQRLLTERPWEKIVPPSDLLDSPICVDLPKPIKPMNVVFPRRNRSCKGKVNRETILKLANRFNELPVDNDMEYVEVGEVSLPQFGPHDIRIHHTDRPVRSTNSYSTWDDGRFSVENSATWFYSPKYTASYFVGPMDISTKEAKKHMARINQLTRDGFFEKSRQVADLLSNGDNDLYQLLLWQNDDDQSEWLSGKYVSYSKQDLLFRITQRAKNLERVRVQRARDVFLDTFVKENKIFYEGLKTVQEKYGKVTYCSFEGCKRPYVCKECMRCSVHCHADLFPHVRVPSRFTKNTKNTEKIEKKIFEEAQEQRPEFGWQFTNFADNLRPSRKGEAQAMFDAQVTRLVDGISHALGNIRVNHSVDLGIQHSANMLVTASENLTQATGKDWKSYLPGVALLVCGLVKSWPDKINCAIHVASFINSCGLSPTVIDWVKRSIDHILNMRTGQGQADGVDVGIPPAAISTITDLFPKIGGICMVLLTAFGVKNLPGVTKTTDFVNIFARMGNCVTTVERVGEYGQKIALWILDWIKLNILGIPTIKPDEWALIEEWGDEVSELMNSKFEEKIKNNILLRNKVDSLIQRGDKINKQLDGLHIPQKDINGKPTGRQRINTSMMYLMKCRDIAVGSGAGCTEQRVQPIIVHIVGASGTGKSSIMYPLFADLLSSMDCREENDITERIYFKYPTEDDRWDGFHSGVKIVVCDDFGARKDTEAHPSNEPLDAIRMGNTAHWQLPMAHLQDKGTTYFRAPVVIWTSNRSQFKFESLTNPEAVVRRVNCRFRQIPHPDFSRKMRQGDVEVDVLDQVKVSDACKADPLAVLGCSVFVELDPHAPTDVELHPGVTLTYKEMAQKVCDLNIVNLSRFTVYNAAVKNYAALVRERDQNGFVGPAQAWVGPDWEEFIDKVSIDERKKHKDRLAMMNQVEAGIYRNKVLMKCVAWQVEGGTPCYFERSHNGDHLDVFSTISTITRDVEELEDSYHDLGDLYKTHCVQIPHDLNECSRDRLIDAFAAGHTAMLAFESDDDKKSAFESCFWRIYGVPTLELVQCDGHHTSDSSLNKLKLQFLKKWYHLRNKYQPHSLGNYINIQASKYPWFGEVVYYCKTFFAIALTTIVSMWAIEFLLRVTAPAPKKSSRRVKKVTTEFYDNPTPGRSTVSTEGYDNLGVTGRTEVKTEAYSGDAAGRPAVKVEFAGPAQMVLDQNAAELGPIYLKNLYKLEVFQNGTWRHLVNALVVMGRYVIINKHVLSQTTVHSWRMRNSMCSAGYQFDLWNCNKQVFPNSHPLHGKRDMMIVEMPSNFPQHKDIVSKFMTSEDFSRFSTLSQICLTGYSRTSEIEVRHYFSNTVGVEDAEYMLMNGTDNIGIIRHFILYGIQTSRGDCGAVICAYDKNFNRKLCGIHAGGLDNSKYQGVGQPIHQGVIRDYLDALIPRRDDSQHCPDPELKCEIECVNIETESGNIISCPALQALGGNISYVGQAHSPVYQAKNSNIYPSPLHGVIAKPTMKPARLTRFKNEEGVVLDPMSMAREKVKPIPPPVEEDLLEACVYDLSQTICNHIKDEDQRVLSFEEAITGVEGDEFKSGINRSTSPGYGWIKKGKGKTHWLGSDEYKVNDPELLVSYNKMLNKCLSGQRPSVIWTDTLKDERRPIAKVESGKTRLFSVGEMTYTILFRQYFLGFTAHMMRNRIDVESCVGLNVYNSDWNKLAFRIQEVGDKVIAGDFSNYDGTLNAQFLWSVLDIIEDFYQGSDEERQVRCALWSEIVNSIHIFENTVYMWNHSNPSGCPITAILNSVYHSIAARYVYVLVARKYEPKVADLAAYARFVRHINYGDDDIWNISNKIIQWFNQRTITEAFEEIGMTYTDEAKTGTYAEFRTLDEVCFLKRAFRWDETQNRYRAPLSLDTIREMPMWVHGKIDHYQLTATTLEEAVHELAQHDEAIFNRELPAFEKARKIIALQTPCVLKTYKHYQSIEHYRWCYGIEPLEETDINVRLGPQQSTDELVNSSSSMIAIGCDRKETITERLCMRSNPEFETPSALTTLGQTERIRLIRCGQAQNMNTQSTYSGGLGASSSGGGDSMFHEPDRQIEQTQTVTFIEDGEVSKDPEPSSTPIMDYLSVANDSLVNDVKGFLQRPIQLKTFVWSSTQAIMVDVAPKMLLPNDWFANQMINEKIQGFRYLRCDLHVRVQVNAQPFNAGRLIVWFEPFGNQQEYQPSNASHLGGITGYRHIDLDISVATSVELNIPYICPLSHFDLITGGGNLGYVRAIVYSPLTGSADVDGTVWLRADNIDIQMPTGKPLATWTPITQRHGQAQMDSVEETRREEENVSVTKPKGGTASKVLQTLGTIGRALFWVPTIGAGVAAAGAISTGIGAALKIFGWSKPTDIHVPTLFQPTFNRHIANYDGDIKAKPLGLDSTNQVMIPATLFNTDKDEMALSHILSQPVYMDRFQMKGVDTQGSYIWRWPVNPDSCNRFTALGSALSVRLNTYLSFLSQSFQVWRGGIQYHFKIVKTPFHSGRIRVSFVPGADLSDDPTTFNIDKSYSKVYDIRDLTDFCFEVPFVYNKPWMDKILAGNIGSNLSDYKPTGMIYVEVLNALRNPSVCADTIDLIVETCAGKDFQYGFFGISEKYYINYEAVEPASFIQSARQGPAQSADCEDFFKTSKMNGTNPNQLGIGERITSVRQILKRYGPFPDPLPIVPAEKANLIFPFETGHKRAHDPSFDSAPFFCAYEWFTSLYRMKVGSMRTLLSNTFGATPVGQTSFVTGVWNTNPIIEMPVDHFYQDVILGEYGLSSIDGGLPRVNYYHDPEQVLELDVPFYQPNPVLPTTVGGITYSTGEALNLIPSNAGFLVYVCNSAAVDMYRSIGEDFSFGYLIGPPTTSTGNPD